MEFRAVVSAPFLPLLLAACGSAGTGAAGGGFAVRSDGATLTFLHGARTVAAYRLLDRDVPGHPEQSRCGYFSELYAPSGKLLTEDGPGDHLHHRGLFLAWNRVAWIPAGAADTEAAVNFWELKEGSGRKGPAALLDRREDADGASFAVRHDWRIGGRVILAETLRCRLRSPAPDVHALDLDFNLAPAGGAVTLDEYGHHNGTGPWYGALGLRGAAAFPPEALVFTYSDGRDRASADNARAEGAWIDLSGPIGGASAGVAIAVHPENPPHRLSHWRRLRFLDADLTALGAVRIEPGRPLRLRYRVLLHDGDAASARVGDRTRW